MVSNPDNASLIVSLEENLALHDCGAELFTWFAIERLSAGSGATSAELSVSLMDADGQQQSRSVELRWNAASSAAKPLIVQPKVQTELGALGVACALIPTLLGRRVLSVAGEGERFDYRIGNETGECGLEVSGTLSESADELRERHRQKIRQLRENPDRLDGYVVVVGFTRREVLISYHLPLSEENP